MTGINPSEKNPDNPKVWSCNACEYTFDIPRAWVKTNNLGYQIIINWRSTEWLIEAHMKFHEEDLITGIEAWLDAPA